MACPFPSKQPPTPVKQAIFLLIWVKAAPNLQIPSLRKIPYFHLISWCGNFLKRHSFRTPETLPKLCLSIKFPHQEIS